jgi:type I pantothenate kinase
VSEQPATVVATLAAARAGPGHPVVVGIAGGVAAGKSTLAAAVAAARPDWRVEVVPTDGFLFPNSALAARGLLARKGFPESYDVDAIRAFVDAARAGRLPRAVPTYSHITYDRDGQRTVEPADLVVVEGVNVLAAVPDLLDVAVYLDAADELLATWYRDRFLQLCAEGRDDPTSFYAAFADWSEEALSGLADQVWRDVNRVNLRDHIAPSRGHADCVITKGSGHRVLAVTLRDDARGRGGAR